MFSIAKKFIHFQGKLVEVLRIHPEHRVKNPDGLKEWYETDVLLRKDGFFYFCRTVQEAEIISEN